MIDVNTFVRGMAWHDIGKPFYLGSERHSRLGYLYLYALGYPDEALVTLAHHARSFPSHLLQYWGFDGVVAEIPAIVTFGNALDVAAAATYSFIEENPEQIGGEAHHSWQNPFSRLPQRSPILERSFNVTLDQMQSGEVTSSFESYLGRWRDPDSGAGLSTETLDILAAALRQANLRGRWTQAGRVSFPEQRDLAHRALLHCTAQYPERTYPPMNDTTLKAHAHLSGVLAFVLYRNIERSCPQLLAQKIVRQGNVAQVNGQPLRNFLRTTYDLAIQHLDGFLVHISLEGHRDLFANAVRLDDLHGTRALAGMTLDALVETMARELGVPELAEYLVVIRTPFALTYYLPGSIGEAGLRETTRRAYDAAVERVAGDLIGELEADFRRADPPLDWASQRSDLARQLHALAYGLCVELVDVQERANLGEFSAALGKRLVEAHAKSLAQPAFPRGQIDQVQADLELPGGEVGSVHDVCQVCETHPTCREFNKRMNEGDVYLRKAVHEFRGEPEPICVSCIARRVLAHGTVRSRPLEKMLKLKQDDRTVVARQKDGPALPPNLARSAILASEDDHVDMGAAFVRKARSAKKRAQGQKLDVFPTVHYAADETGNVALLTLRPTGALFDAYSYRDLVDWLEAGPPRLDKLGIGYEAEALREAFEATTVEYVKQVKENKPDQVDQVTVTSPHMARLLSRIDQVNGFYTALQERLEACPLRVLPIDTVYPTARLMVPADQIDAALAVLDRAIAEDLFSASLGRAERAFLRHLVPPLLLGSVVVLKEKYPLYLALEAERVLMQRLAEAPANQYWGRALSEGEGEGDPLPSDSWFGLRLGLCDLRGTLAERGPWQGQILWQDLGGVLALEGRLDRMTVLHRAILEQDADKKPLADALALIRANVTHLDLEDVVRLEDAVTFRPVLFLKRLTREGRAASKEVHG